MSFDQFMQAQIAAIEASGLTPDAWITLYAEQFRAEHQVDDQTSTPSL